MCGRNVFKYICSLSLAAVFVFSAVLQTGAEEYLYNKTGDVNADGVFDTDDISDMKKWLLGIGELKDWQQGDFAEDSEINIFDLIIMERALAYKESLPEPEVTEPETTEPEMTEPEVTEPEPEKTIEAPINAVNASMPSKGNVKLLMFYVDFADKKYSNNIYSIEQIDRELFGNGETGYPYENLTNWFERSSYGNLHVDGDIFRYTCSGKMADYQDETGYERLVMEVLKGLDSQIEYSNYDSDNDGVIDVLSFTLPLEDADDETKRFWYGSTSTWYDNAYFTVDNMKIDKYIMLDEMPVAGKMKDVKKTLIHEMGHCMGLADYYKYESFYDYEGFHGDAGDTRMDDSIGDFCGFDKLMLGWLKESEIQKYTGSGMQTFELADASVTGNCLILPISSESDNYNSEYFLVEYVSDKGNNSDIYSFFDRSGVRIFHVQGELVTDYWGRTNFKYHNYSEHYMGDDKIRILQLVNDNNGFYHTGDTAAFGTSNFAAYDSNGYQSINTGYTVSIGGFADGKYSITVNKY